MKITYIEETTAGQQELFDENLEAFDPPQYTEVQLPSGEGAITGINRSALEGERSMEKAPQFFIWGYFPGYYKFTAGDVFPLSQEEVDALKHAEELLSTKQTIEEVIRSTFIEESEQPVEVTIGEGTFTFNGGQDSASYIMGAMDLAQALGEESVIITDIDNVGVTMSFESGNTVAVTIAAAFRAAFFKKQDALVDLANS